MVNLSGLQSVHISQGEDCTFAVALTQLLVGDFGGAPASEFSITILDGDSSNGAIIDGCGIFTYQVVGSPNISGFTSAWGTVVAEDKNSPVLAELPTAPTPLFCDAIAEVNINNIAAEVSRCWIQSGGSATSLNNSLDPELEARLLAAGGLPDFRDGCSAVTICVRDQLLNNTACGNTILRRTFTAHDGDCLNLGGEENPPVQASYDIVFTQPSLAEVSGVVSTVSFDCSQYDASGPRPTPSPEDYPFILDASGSAVYLNSFFCNLTTTFSDGPSIETCPSAYTFNRTFTVVDWCQAALAPRTFTQLVKVGDFDPPSIIPPTQDLDFDGVADGLPLRFRATTVGCRGVFAIPIPPISDNCSAFSTQAFVYRNGVLTSSPLGPYSLEETTVLSLEMGAHVIRYVATDECGNQTFLDIPILVEDGTSPIAICKNELQFSLGSAGSSMLPAIALNAASSDHCAAVSFRIAKLGADNEAISPYAPNLMLSCEDLGYIRLGLEVSDPSGNLNFCWLEVLVEDKLAPICIPPPSYSLECSELQGVFPANLENFFNQDPLAATALLDTHFGGASATDNCPGSQTHQQIFDGRNSCGIGNIQRYFTATDGQGLVNTANCQQFLAVGGRHDYSIILPADEEANDCVAPNYIGVDYQTAACDLINIATRVDTFLSLAAECYKLRFTYDIINWCEYNGVNNPYIIPRDADANNVVGEAIWLHITPASGMGTPNDLAFLDRDSIRNNGNSIGNLDIGDGGLLAGSHPGGYGLDGSRGAFRYQQFVKVYDDSPPLLLIEQPEQPGLAIDNSCLGDIQLRFRVDDLCSPGSVNFSAQLDIFIQDTNGDGILTLAEFVPSSSVTSAIAPDTTAGDFLIALDNVPIGEHAVRLIASDGCGNISVGIIRFHIADRKAPTPICINSLTVTLMPNEAGGGQAAVLVNDFLASTTSDCSEVVGYAIYRETESAQAAFSPSVQDTALLLNCTDDSLLLVRVYAIDGAANYDYCQATVQVQEHDSRPCTPATTGILTGQILTLDEEALGGVNVYITGENEQTATTDALGIFTFQDLAFGEDYSLLPYADNDHMNGVSTFDILAISRHILGLFAFTSPYQYIAADANRSQEITVRDLIVIRRLILGLDNSFDNNTSWRFIDATYTFPEFNNPWLEIFPELANINNFSFSQQVDFIAVKVGDINRDADPGRMLNTANAQHNNSRSTKAILEARLLTPESTVARQQALRQEQNCHTWAVYTKDHDLLGLQATLTLAEGLALVEIIDGQLRANEHLGLRFLDRGWITMAYQQASAPLATDKPLFSIVLAGSEMASARKMLQLGSEYTIAEAYPIDGGIQGLELRYEEEAAARPLAANELYQNFPNPLKYQTSIAFTAQAAGWARLLIHDSQGRLVAQMNQDAVPGRNTFSLERQALPKASAWYSYTLVLEGFSASRRMLVLD